MKNNGRRSCLKRLAVAGLLGTAGLDGFFRTALANAAKPVVPGGAKAQGDRPD